MRRLVMIGASGHGKVCADIARKIGYEDILFLDDDPEKKTCGRYPVEGAAGDFRKHLTSADFFVSIGNAAIRERITEEIKNAGGIIATLVHPCAVINDWVNIGMGTVVMAGVVINPETVVGRGGIVNTSSSIDHDCRIGDFVHVSVGTHIAGNVEIGRRSWIGAGATVSNNVKICGDCIIGAGAVVVGDIRQAGTYVGVPARRLQGSGKNEKKGVDDCDGPVHDRAV